MLTLILGETGSGKSRWAEQLCRRFRDDPAGGGQCFYVATMIPVGMGEGGLATVARHRAQREGLGFLTVEEPLAMARVPAGAGDIVLLEDAPNLLANHLFSPGGSRSWEAVAEDILTLAARCAQLVVVSFPVPAGAGCDRETLEYIAGIDALNRAIRQAAEMVLYIENGRALLHKGCRAFLSAQAFTAQRPSAMIRTRDRRQQQRRS